MEIVNQIINTLNRNQNILNKIKIKKNKNKNINLNNKRHNNLGPKQIKAKIKIQSIDKKMKNNRSSNKKIKRRNNSILNLTKILKLLFST